MEEIEIWLDDRTLLVGEVKESDESFDHEFGREYVKEPRLESLSVIVYIEGMDEDVTKALELNGRIEQFKARFMDLYREQVLRIA